jgi:hypothetical protein
MYKYVINKSSRLMTTEPYSGPACDSAGVPQGKIYENWNDAVKDAQKLTEVNPVGFVVVPLPTDTGPKLYVWDNVFCFMDAD